MRNGLFIIVYSYFSYIIRGSMGVLAYFFIRGGALAVVNVGGDADTNAAVACAILGAKYGYQAIPKKYKSVWVHDKSSY